MKKILAILLAVILVISMVACSNGEKQDETDEDNDASVGKNTIEISSGSFEYDTNDEGDYEIGKYIPSSPKVIDLLELPKTVDGREIVGIASSAFKHQLSLKAVTIPETYTYIGECAFYDCDNLEKVTMADSVVSIGASAFEKCEKLADLTLSKSIAEISAYAFKDCTSIKAIALTEATVKIADGAFFGCSALETLTVTDKLQSVVKNAFYGCEALVYTVDGNAKYLGNTENPHLVLVSAADLNIEECTVNEKTEIIADGAFSNCEDIQSITLSDSVRAVSNACFENCEELNFNEYENGYYLGSAENEHMVFVGLIKHSVENFKLHADTKIILSNALASCPNIEDISYEKSSADWDKIIKTFDWNNEMIIVIHCSDKEITVES